MTAQPAVILAAPDLLGPFVEAAVAEYRASLASAGPDGARHFPRCWALLAGRLGEDAVRVERLVFAPNARARGLARAEFDEVIAPRFGAAYQSEQRGYWCDPRTLFSIHRACEEDGLELLGSIHLHPDWHRIGPPHERGLVLDERPTPMDEHVFRLTGWPANLICYLESRDGELAHALAAWSLPLGAPEGTPPRRLPLRVALGPAHASPRRALRPVAAPA